jgi:hypothetical protein
MVKNSTGGNKSKGMARKLVQAPTNHSLRPSASSDEIYGVVSKMLGNGMCYVNVIDARIKNNDSNDKIILCHIRSKFSGRSKRSNFIAAGSTVLVGLRDWEAPNFKHCDLLEIYDANDLALLAKIPGFYIPISNNNNEPYSSYNRDLVEFSNESYIEPIPETLVYSSTSNTYPYNSFNFDDI